MHNYHHYTHLTFQAIRDMPPFQPLAEHNINPDTTNEITDDDELPPLIPFSELSVVEQDAILDRPHREPTDDQQNAIRRAQHTRQPQPPLRPRLTANGHHAAIIYDIRMATHNDNHEPSSPHDDSDYSYPHSVPGTDDPDPPDALYHDHIPPNNTSTQHNPPADLTLPQILSWITSETRWTQRTVSREIP
jgi:hypothetical protein